MIHILKINGNYWFLDATTQEGFVKRSGPYADGELKTVLKSRFNVTDTALAEAMSKADSIGEGEISLR